MHSLKQYSMKQFGRLCLSLAILFTLSSITVHAQDGVLLLTLYGYEQEDVDGDLLIEQIHSLQEESEIGQLLQEQSELKSVVSNFYNEIQEEKQAEIYSSLEEYITKIGQVESNMAQSIDGPIQDLLTLNKERSALLRLVQEVEQASWNSYSYSTYKYDIKQTLEQIENLSEVYDNLMKIGNIGDITNIQWILPNEYHVTSGYGYRLNPITRDRTSFHSGVDFRAPEGTPVKALFSGTVIGTGYSQSGGNYVKVSSADDSIRYVYFHLSSIDVKEGDTIQQYDVIAHTGSTGRDCTGPHLHLGLYIYGVAVDCRYLFER